MLPYLHGLGVLQDEVRVVNMGAVDEKLMNSWRLWPCSWFSSNVYDAHEYIYGDILMSHDTKNGQCHATTSCCPHGMTLAEFALVSKWRSIFDYTVGGSINYSALFFDLAHHARWLFGDECTFAESRSTFDFVLYSR